MRLNKFSAVLAFTVVMLARLASAQASSLTHTFLSSTPDPIPTGYRVTIIAYVSDAYYDPVTSGSIQLFYGEQLLGTQNLNSQGNAIFIGPTQGLALGTYTLTAAYSGTPDGYPASTGQGTVTIIADQTTTTELSIGESSEYVVGDSIPLTAYIYGSSNEVPPGTITFTTATNLTLGSAPINDVNYSGQAKLTINTAGSSPGDYSLIANYYGEDSSTASESSPVSLTLLASTPTNLGFAASPTTVTIGYPVTLYVDATPVYGNTAPKGNVLISLNGNTVLTIPLPTVQGSVSSNNITVSTTGLAAGTYQLTATYPGDATDNEATESATVTLVGTSTTTVSASPNPVTKGTATFLTATVTGTSGQTPTGTVEFELSGTDIDEAGLGSSGTTTPLPLSTSALLPGSYTITALYSGDANNPASTGTATLVVQ